MNTDVLHKCTRQKHFQQIHINYRKTCPKQHANLYTHIFTTPSAKKNSWKEHKFEFAEEIFVYGLQGKLKKKT